MNKSFLWLFCLVFAALCLSGCDSRPAGSRYSLALPEIPPAWELIPGQLQWKIEWHDPDGRLQTRDILSGERPEISLPGTGVSAVYAWPYWSELAINPGVFKPAGGLFPFDVQGNSLLLSWSGGVDAVLYRELGVASAKTSPSQSSVPRLPGYFNWPRFRELYNDTGVNAEYRVDPWLADWPGIAARIWQSGFDKRRLVPQARQLLHIPVGPGPWMSTSPFALPLVFDGEPQFPVRTVAAGSLPGTLGPPDTWVSSEGILRCNTETYFFAQWVVSSE